MGGRADGPAALYARLRGEHEGSAPALAFVRPDGTVRGYTRDELFAAAGALAGRLPGDLPDGPVGILLDRQEDQVLHYLALLAAGRVPCILTPRHRKLDPDYYAANTSGVLAQIGFAALVTETAGLDAAVPTVLSPGALAARAGHGEAPAPPAGFGGAAFLQFSSGTTGIKKGVTVTAAAASAQLDAYGAAIEMTAGDVIVGWLPLYHDMGFITSLHLPLAHGARAVLLDPIDWVGDPRRYLALVTEHRATLGWHPNFAYQFMVDRVRDTSAYDLSSLRGLANCSEPATHRAQAAFAERFGPAGLAPGVFWGCYAAAETTFAMTHGFASDAEGLDPDGPTGQAGVPLPVLSVGRPIAGVDLWTERPDGTLADDGEVGELIVRAPFLATGYYGRADATASAFPDGTYRTGDLGYRRGPDVYVTGRATDLMIVAGVNVHPGDVEALVSREPGVQPGRVAAFASFDERAQTDRVTVLVEPADPDVKIDTVGIRVRLVGVLELANFEVRVVPRGWLVKSSSGKVARRANRDKWKALA